MPLLPIQYKIFKILKICGWPSLLECHFKSFLCATMGRKSLLCISGPGTCIYHQASNMNCEKFVSYMFKGYNFYFAHCVNEFEALEHVLNQSLQVFIDLLLCIHVKGPNAYRRFFFPWIMFSVLSALWNLYIVYRSTN